MIKKIEDEDNNQNDANTPSRMDLYSRYSGVSSHLAWELERSRAKHALRVKAMRPLVDTTSPRSFLSRRQNLKKEQLDKGFP